MNYSNPLDAVPDVSLETRLIVTENQCGGSRLKDMSLDQLMAPSRHFRHLSLQDK